MKRLALFTILVVMTFSAKSQQWMEVINNTGCYFHYTFKVSPVPLCDGSLAQSITYCVAPGTTNVHDISSTSAPFYPTWGVYCCGGTWVGAAARYDFMRIYEQVDCSTCPSSGTGQIIGDACSGWPTSTVLSTTGCSNCSSVTASWTTYPGGPSITLN